jgi:hypothetical protein
MEIRGEGEKSSETLNNNIPFVLRFLALSSSRPYRNWLLEPDLKLLALYQDDLVACNARAFAQDVQ